MESRCVSLFRSEHGNACEVGRCDGTRASAQRQPHAGRPWTQQDPKWQSEAAGAELREALTPGREPAGVRRPDALPAAAAEIAMADIFSEEEYGVLLGRGHRHGPDKSQEPEQLLGHDELAVAIFLPPEQCGLDLRGWPRVRVSGQSVLESWTFQERFRKRPGVGRVHPSRCGYC